ncbi:MAG: exodeoxyribonuclease VII large subunit [Tepidiformaceae bacterium]
MSSTPQAVTPSAILTILRDVIEESEIFSDLWVQAEVSNYTRSSPGHRYFSLKDPGGVLRSVLFASKMPGFQMKDGDRVLAHGYISIYPTRGELQFVADFVRPEGAGLLAAKYEELKARLDEEGLFDPARKRPLPRFPKKIGVVTSPTGAALQDIKNVLARRWPLATLVLSPATVQGEQAPAQILAALRRLTREPGLELAILARGGGSIEDLWAFNDEGVARAIFGFPVPVVSGVGHETDETIADLVADMRAPTPSAAAERSSPDAAQLARAFFVLERGMASAAREAIGSRALDVDACLRRMQGSAPDLGGLSRDVAEILRDLHSALERRCTTDRARFEGLSARLVALDPMATLGRGYAIVQRAGGNKQVVASIRKIKPGERLQVSVADGAFWAEVS